MRALLVVLVALGMAGCSTDSIRIFGPKPPAVKRDPIAELKALARRHGMYWRVYCTGAGVGSDHEFQAELCKANCDKMYIEDGASTWWAGRGATQTEAAMDLVDDYPNRPYAPEHRPEYKAKQCDTPTIGGGPE